MIISPATINDTGIYTCRNRIGFQPIGDSTQNDTEDDAKNITIGKTETNKRGILRDEIVLNLAIDIQ